MHLDYAAEDARDIANAPLENQKAATDALPGRQGFLTHASVLTVNGDANASIVLRGLYVNRKVLCQDVPAPPPGATSVMLAPATTRRVVTAAVAVPRAAKNRASTATESGTFHSTSR